MIAKRVERSANVRDNFTGLGRYIAAAKDPGEKLDQLWMVNCDAGETPEDLETALAEVEAVRQMKPDVDDKTYHLVVSFHPDEEKKLAPDDLKAIEREFAEALGYGEHQRVAATHQNTDHYHLHMAINKVHPENLKLHTPFRDFKTLEQVCRRIERKYDLVVDLGMSDKERSAPGLGAKARDFEAQTWQESFQRYMQENKADILASLAASKDWHQFHKHLATFDIAIRLRANGLVFTSADGKQAMKASQLDRSCSKPALEKRLGPFQPMMEGATAQPKPKQRYTAKPLTRHPGTSRLWKRFTQQRQSSLARRAIANWRLYLMGEAHTDPLALVIIMAHQEALRALFSVNEAPKAEQQRRIPKTVVPILNAWEKKGEWQEPKRRAANKGDAPPKAEQLDNTVGFIRNKDELIVGLRIISPAGRFMEISSTDKKKEQIRKAPERGPLS